MSGIKRAINERRRRVSPPLRWLIRVTGVIVPRRLRSDWRQEWEAELYRRESMLVEWDRLNGRARFDLLRRSMGAFRDALLLQPKRLEDEMFQDLRYGLRVSLKNPGFTFVAVLTLALGVGANTAIFSVVNALVLRPLPYPDAERLVWVEESSKADTGQPAWGAHFLNWRENSKTLAGVAQVDGTTQTLTGAGEPERVAVGKISSGFLPLLGAQPLPGGRNFTAEEDRPGGERVAILSYALWQRRFSGDPNVVGRSVTLNDAGFTVIGVAPADFRFFNAFDVWAPLALNPQTELAGPNHSFQTTVARIKPGVSIEQARAEMDLLSQNYETAKPDGAQRFDSRTRLTPLQEHLVGKTRQALLVLSGAVALILLIACANVANLLLARAAGRSSELAIRAALGASRLRLARQSMTECLSLAAAGGLAGLLLAYWGVRLIGALISTDTIGDLARVTSIKIDLRALGFTLFVTLLTGLLFGLLPTLRLSHPNLNDSLKHGGRGGGLQGSGLRKSLMVSEVALAVILLVGAGLLIRSFVKLLNTDPGYRADGLLTARFQAPARYGDPAQRARFYEQILQRLAALPGVSAVGATSQLPLLRYNMGGALRVEGRPAQEGEKPVAAPISSVSPDYFRAMGIGLRAGRFLNDGDAQGAPGAVILSETVARRLFPNDDPIGKRLAVASFNDGPATVVGVVADTRHQGLDKEINGEAYLSYRQLPRPSVAVALRTTVDPLSLAPALRSAAREVDPSMPVYDVATMEERLSSSVATRRFNLLLLGVFAAIALLLAGVGVYGVISYVGAERTRETGVRMALGAGRADITRLFIRQGMSMVMVGVALGLIGAFALTRSMAVLLYGVTPADPLTFIGVAALLSSVALLACYLPARRAARVDPLVALRQD